MSISIHRWRLVKLFVNYFDCLLRIEICLRALSLAFAILFHSVYVCVCVFLCHLTCYQQRWPESSFLLNILNFMQKKIQVLGMVEPSLITLFNEINIR